jgi:peroxiredoxin
MIEAYNNLSMQYIILAITSVILISSCTLTQSPNSTPVVSPSEEELFVPSPTQSTGTGELTLTGADIVSLSGVLDTTFTYLDSENKSYSSGTLRNIIGRYPHTVVYFYPKDGTPNCTIQALDFSMMLADFRAKGYNIIGVSKDNLESHKAFAERNELKIELLEDGNGDLLRAFGAEGPLQVYGNGEELSDIIRSTYVIDSNGI